VIEIGKLKKQAGADTNLHTPRREAEIVDRLMSRRPSARCIVKSCPHRCRLRAPRKWPT
jgi:chorismate mutase